MRCSIQELMLIVFSCKLQDEEPDDTACLKAAYAKAPSPASCSGSPAMTSTPAASSSRRKRTLDSVVKILHNTKKYMAPQATEATPPLRNERAESPLSLTTPQPPAIAVGTTAAADFITAKNINNNNVTIDPNTGLEVQHSSQRKKGPFGKKRLVEIVDANPNALGSDSASDVSLNSSVGGSDATCHICNKVLSTKASYKRHMNFHRNIYPHRCSVCNKGFAVKGDLRGHEATHTNEKEFPCPGCERVFAYKKNLQMHMRKKHNIGSPMESWPKEEPRSWPKEELGEAQATTGAWPVREAIHAGGELTYAYVS